MSRRQLLHGLALPALGLLATALAAPPAWASCGDYVIVGRPMFLDPMTARAMPTSDPAQPGSPCEGPSCSSDPLGPISPPLVIDLTTRDKACRAALLGVDGERPARPTAASTAAVPIHRTLGIFRPPRQPAL